jgi:hypothetical protein
VTESRPRCLMDVISDTGCGTGFVTAARLSLHLALPAVFLVHFAGLARADQLSETTKIGFALRPRRCR